MILSYPIMSNQLQRTQPASLANLNAVTRSEQEAGSYFGRLTSIALLTPLLIQAFSLSVPSSSLSAIIPNRAPFNLLTDSRLEFRLHGFTWAAGKQIVAFGGARIYFYGPLGQFAAAKQICAADSAGDDMHNYGNVACVDVSGRTDVIVRVQRTVTLWPQGEWRLEMWNTIGDGYQATSCASGNPCPISTIRGTDLHGTQVLNPAPQASGALSWLKWWSTSVPLNSAIPTVADASDLANWIFNNSLTDQSPQGLTLSLSNPNYVSTPAYRPACGIVDSVLNAQGASTLQSSSYPLDGGTDLFYSWSSLDGPTTPWFSGQIPNPTISNLAYGAYKIQLRVTDSSSQFSTCTKLMVATANYANTTVDPGHPAAAGIVYWLDNISDPLRSFIMQFLAQRLDVTIGSNQNMAIVCATLGRSCFWPVYLDQSIFTPDVQYSLFPFATGLGLDMESILNHMKIDYSIPAMAGHGPAGNLNLGQFDLFDNNSGAGATYTTSHAGAYLLSGGTYTDVTVPIYNGSTPQTIADKLLLGYALPFAQVNMTLAVPRGGGIVTWQYWNGSWTTLTITSDGTNGLLKSGQINFTPPSRLEGALRKIGYLEVLDPSCDFRRFYKSSLQARLGR